MSEYIVYMITKCESCRGTGTYDCLADYALNRTCVDCKGVGHTRLTPVLLKDAVKALLKENPQLFYYERYPKLK